MRYAELQELLKKADSASELRKACQEVSTAGGFEHYIYVCRFPTSIAQPYHISLNGFPKPWQDHYEQQKYYQIDPVTTHALNSVRPIVWDEIERKTPAIKQLFSEAIQFKMGHGITVPIHGHSGEQALLSLAREKPIPKNPEQRIPMIQYAQYFTPLVHEAIARRVASQQGKTTPGKRLTKREKHCLSLAADGMTTNEIAEQLNLAARTVVFHLSNAAQKLGTRGRQDAIAQAVAHGEISRREDREDWPTIYEIE